MKKNGPVFGPLFIAYALVVLIIRSFFFMVGNLGLPEPQVQINGVHIHHYLFGIAILFLVAISAIHQKFSQKTLATLLGISMAMIIDEFQFLVKLAEVKYPAQEIDTITVVGLILLALAVFEKYPLKKMVTFPKLNLVSKIVIGIMLWIILFGGPFGIKPINAEMKEHHIKISRYIPHVHMYRQKH